jgi:hypothetical protein
MHIYLFVGTPEERAYAEMLDDPHDDGSHPSSTELKRVLDERARHRVRHRAVLSGTGEASLMHQFLSGEWSFLAERYPEVYDFLDAGIRPDPSDRPTDHGAWLRAGIQAFDHVVHARTAGKVDSSSSSSSNPRFGTLWRPSSSSSSSSMTTTPRETKQQAEHASFVPAVSSARDPRAIAFTQYCKGAIVVACAPDAPYLTWMDRAATKQQQQQQPAETKTHADTAAHRLCQMVQWMLVYVFMSSGKNSSFEWPRARASRPVIALCTALDIVRQMLSFCNASQPRRDDTPPDNASLSAWQAWRESHADLSLRARTDHTAPEFVRRAIISKENAPLMAATALLMADKLYMPRDEYVNAQWYCAMLGMRYTAADMVSMKASGQYTSAQLAGMAQELRFTPAAMRDMERIIIGTVGCPFYQNMFDMGIWLPGDRGLDLRLQRQRIKHIMRQRTDGAHFVQTHGIVGANVAAGLPEIVMGADFTSPNGGLYLRPCEALDVHLTDPLLFRQRMHAIMVQCGLCVDYARVLEAIRLESVDDMIESAIATTEAWPPTMKVAACAFAIRMAFAGQPTLQPTQARVLGHELTRQMLSTIRHPRARIASLALGSPAQALVSNDWKQRKKRNVVDDGADGDAPMPQATAKPAATAAKVMMDDVDDDDDNGSALLATSPDNVLLSKELSA